MAGRILSVSYDPMLLKTRQHLLEKEGYVVISAEGFAEALERCHDGSYDLVVMGHSIPHKDKEALFKIVTQDCAVPVIALLRGGESSLEGAAESVDPMDPRRFIEVVHRALAGKTQAKA